MQSIAPRTFTASSPEFGKCTACNWYRNVWSFKSYYDSILLQGFSDFSP